MKRIVLVLATVVLAFGLTAPLSAQQARKSPHETISRLVQNNRVTIVYGRPYTRHPQTNAPRKIWGGLVPFGKIWRLGADEATLFITQQPLLLGQAEIPAGAYTLFMLPAADGSAELLINREIGQWGVDPYDRATEIARVPLQRQELATPVDQFTIAIDNGSTAGGVLSFSWEKVQYSVPFRVRK
ncbi:DUF2911 domain-containing protein [Opitutus sp. ER46]|uniref:DUF2911 domain-containing protein n=1 Tax=Opitutus sp. ER46 TaxID=2161864 RepID=UPI000D30DB92|nr:DUF2911 domain-containing protein [Opitutus sp. ER46]PTX91172.1 hypothetical protein DB354_21310 [Opitutus sp. ER46]